MQQSKLRMTKQLIAHEIGHALVGLFFDKKKVPEQAEFYLDSDDGAAADQTSSIVPPSTKKYTLFFSIDGKLYHLDEIWVLGGIIGELLYSQKFDPWRARADFEDFLYRALVGKPKNYSKLSKQVAEEFYGWFYSTTNTQNFSYFAENAKECRFVPSKYKTLCVEEIEEMFPKFYEIFCAIEEIFPAEVYKKMVNSIQISQEKPCLYWIDLIALFQKHFPEQSDKLLKNQI